MSDRFWDVVSAPLPRTRTAEEIRLPSAVAVHAALPQNVTLAIPSSTRQRVRSLITGSEAHASHRTLHRRPFAHLDPRCGALSASTRLCRRRHEAAVVHGRGAAGDLPAGGR